MATKKKAKKAPAKRKATAPAKSAKRSARKPARKVVAKKRAVSARGKAKAGARKAARRPAPAPKAKAKAKLKATPTVRASAPKAKPLRRRDGSGHLDPRYAADLLAQSGRPEADPSSFITGPRSKDDLVEELGEGFVEEATSAEYAGENALDAEVAEERGGPFVETSGDTEFAHGTDPSNPKGATREPFPRT